MPKIFAIAISLIVPISMMTAQETIAKDASTKNTATKSTTKVRSKRKRVTTPAKKKAVPPKSLNDDNIDNISDEGDFSNCR